METDTDGNVTEDDVRGDVVPASTIAVEVPANAVPDPIIAQYQIYINTRTDQSENEDDHGSISTEESHLLTQEESYISKKLVSEAGLLHSGVETVQITSDADMPRSPANTPKSVGDVVNTALEASADPGQRTSLQKFGDNPSDVCSASIRDADSSFLKPDMQLQEKQAAMDWVDDIEMQAVDKSPQEWCDKLIRLCKLIEGDGDECSVLYLNKGTGKKSFLHQLGTTKGKRFIKENGTFAKQFLSFCYGSPMKKIISEDDDSVSTSIAERKRKPERHKAVDSNKKARLQDEVVTTDKNGDDDDDDSLDDSVNDRIDDEGEVNSDEKQPDQDVRKVGSTAELKIGTRSARQRLQRGRKGMYECNECDFVTKHPLSLRKHHQETHGSARKKSIEKITTVKKEVATPVKEGRNDQETTSDVQQLDKKKGQQISKKKNNEQETPTKIGHLDKMKGQKKSKEVVTETRDEKMRVESDSPNTLGKCVVNKLTGSREFHCRDCEFITNHAMTLRKHVRQNHEEAWNRWYNPSSITEETREEVNNDNNDEASEGVRGKRKSAILFKEKMMELKQRSLDKKKFMCSICSRMFTQRRLTVNHVIKFHPGNNPNKVIVSQEDGEEEAGKKKGTSKKKATDEEWSPKKIKKEKKGNAEEEEVNESEKEESDEKEGSDENEENDDINYREDEENVEQHEEGEEERKKSKRNSKEVKPKPKEKNLNEEENEDYTEERTEPGEEGETQNEEASVERRSSRVKRKKKDGNEDESNLSSEEFVTSDQTSFFCYECGTFFTCLRGLMKHMDITRHTGNPYKKIKERKCLPIEHQSSMSKKRTEFRCSLCKKEYMKEHNCIAHVLEGSCSPRYTQKCPVCRKHFFSKNLYEAHLKEFNHQRDTGDKDSEEKENMLIETGQPIPVEDEVPQTKCLECGKEFPTPEQFRAHVRITEHEQFSATETIYQCYTCMKNFVNEDALTSHMWHTRHTGITEKEKERRYVPVKCYKAGSKRNMWFRCICCASEYKLEENAKAHVAKGDCLPRYKRKCQVCNVHFSSFNKYQLHLKRNVHIRRDPKTRKEGPKEDTEIPSETETIFKCYTCDQYYETLESLRMHMECTKHSGDSKKDGERHVEFFTEPNGLEKYRCSLCKIEFCYQKNCTEHVERSKCKKKYKRKCPLCNITFYSGFNIYQAHMLEKHSDEYPFKCEDCGKMFHHLAGFNCHRTQHKRGPYVPKAAQEESAVMYACDICGKSYTDKGNMKRHRDMHNRGRDFTCEFCGKNYKRKDFLKFHLKYSHGGRSNPDDPNCVCDICGKVLATPKSKYAHMKMAHSDEKPYCCEICGFRTKQLGNLKYHHTIHHSDEKPFECEECGKTFRVHQLLKKHMASHLLKKGLVTEAAKLTKMYRCPDCGKTFVGKSNFESHRLMHFDKELKCAICDSRMRRRGTLRRHYSRIHKFSTAEIDELTKNIPMDKDLIPVKQNNRRVKVEVIEEAGEDISDAESEMEIVTDETLLLEQDTAPSTSQPVEKSISRQRDFVQEAQAQVSLLTSPETAPSTLSFDPNQVQFEEVSVSEEFVALSETVTTETTSTTTQEAEPESQQIILDGPLADMLHEKVIRAVVNTDGSISIHIQE